MAEMNIESGPLHSQETLAKVGLFAGLKEDLKALDHLSSIMKLESFPAGSKLTVEGSLGNELFILVQGQVSIFKNTPDGDSYKVAILKSEVTPAFGESGLIEAEPRSATIICDIECRCLVLSRDAFLKFSSEQPGWAVPILQRISVTLISRLRQTSNDLMLLHKALMDEIRG